MFLKCFNGQWPLCLLQVVVFIAIDVIFVVVIVNQPWGIMMMLNYIKTTPRALLWASLYALHDFPHSFLFLLLSSHRFYLYFSFGHTFARSFISPRRLSTEKTLVTVNVRRAAATLDIDFHSLGCNLGGAIGIFFLVCARS